MVAEDTGRFTHVIAVGNQKGGVCKTTNTVHMASALGELGRRCLVIDLDMNHGSTLHFGIDPDAFLGSFEVLVGAEQPIDVIITNADQEVELPPNVDVIPARRRLESIDQELAKQNKFLVTQDVLVEPLKTLKGRYDYIFLDTAPNATTPTIASYKAADWFILSAMPDPFAIAGINDALQDIQGAQVHGNHHLRLLGVLLSCVDSRTRLSRSLTSHVEEIFSMEGKESLKFDTEISRSIVVPGAQRVGKTVFQTAPAHKVTDQYRAVAREIEDRIRAVLSPLPAEEPEAQPSEAPTPATGGGGGAASGPEAHEQPTSEQVTNG